VQIQIDFDVFKELTARRESEADSYNAVIRRLLKLPNRNTPMLSTANSVPRNALAPDPGSERAEYVREHAPQMNALLNAVGGAWFDNIHFPEGTQFRATYKGQTFLASIQSGRWVGVDGVVRTSPSAAAGAISNTNVNGWRFWFVKRPGDLDWIRLDELKR
jgi:hypothetical protein